MRPTLVIALFAVVAASPQAWAEAPNPAMIEALRPFDSLVGSWKGTGTSQKSSGWKEALDCTWGFRESDGRVSINLYFQDGAMLDVGLLTYFPDGQRYRFIGRTPKKEVLRFEGELTAELTLTLDRVEKSNDKLDRIELKMVRGGQKLIYTFKEQIGTRYYENFANIEHFREGHPLEDFEPNPRCVVTGGLGRIPVEVQGQKLFTACPASRKELLDHPDRYITKQ